MRLINVNTGQLTTFDYRETTPQYAILSHAWSLRGDEDEITFRDIQKHQISHKKGQRKLYGCYRQAKIDGLEYVWVDTCCIDKANFSELQESINSMFRWYEDAAVCYVYLDDVQSEESLRADHDVRNREQSRSSKSFRDSRWFQRGWTLQELLAPKSLEFYDMAWKSLGSRVALSSSVEAATGIPGEFLLEGASFRAASIAQRMSWAAQRVTKKPEDIAYCLFGIFNVVISLHYGEGAERAFVRLQEEIMRRMPSPDDSILAWHLERELVQNIRRDETSNGEVHRFGPILATHPSAFKESGKIAWEPWEDYLTQPMTVSGGFLNIRLRLHHNSHGLSFGLLNCSDSSNDGIVAIPLCRFTPEVDFETNRSRDPARLMRPEGSRGILLAKTTCQDSASTKLLSTRRIYSPQDQRISQEKNERFSFRFDFRGSLGNYLKILEVYPKSRMKEREAYIVTGVDFHRDQTTRTWVRLSHAQPEDNPADVRDFVLLLELEVKAKKPHARCHVMLASRETKLKTLSSHACHEPATVVGRVSAGTHTCNMRADLSEVRRGGYQSYIIRLEPLDTPPEVSIDVTDMVMFRERSSQLGQLFREGQNIAPKINSLFAYGSELVINKDLKHQRKDRLHRELDVLQRKIKDIQKEYDEVEDQLQKDEEAMNQFQGEKEELMVGCNELLQRIATLLRLFESTDASKTRDWGHRMVRQLSNMLISDDPFITSMPNETQKLLMKAAFSGNISAIDILGTILTELNFEDEAGRGLLSTGVSGESFVGLHSILDLGVSINSRDSRGFTALGQAASQGSLAHCIVLLNMGAEIDDSMWISPLIIAVAANQQEVVRLLLASKADANAVNQSGWSALAMAAKRGYVDIIKVLLDNNADINKRSPDGWVPLFVAIQEERLDVVHLLLDRGANLQPPFFPPRGTNFMPSSLSADPRVDGLNDITGLGMTPNDPAIGEWTALGVAAYQGNPEIVKRLLSQGAHFDARNITGQSPLLTAAKRGHQAVVAVLCGQAGLDRRATDHHGDTALHLAVYGGHDDIVRLLIGHEHSMIWEANKLGRTPLFLASLKRHDVIVRLLEGTPRHRRKDGTSLIHEA